MTARTSPYALSFTTGGLFVAEASVAARLYNELNEWRAVRQELASGQHVAFRTKATANRVSREIVSRLELLNREKLSLLAEGAPNVRVAISWIAACRRFEMIADFARTVIAETPATAASMSAAPRTRGVTDGPPSRTKACAMTASRWITSTASLAPATSGNGMPAPLRISRLSPRCLRRRCSRSAASIKVVTEMRTRQDFLRFGARILWRDLAEGSDRNATLPACSAAANAVLRDKRLLA